MYHDDDGNQGRIRAIGHRLFAPRTPPRKLKITYSAQISHFFPRTRRELARTCSCGAFMESGETYDLFLSSHDGHTKHLMG